MSILKDIQAEIGGDPFVVNLKQILQKGEGVTEQILDLENQTVTIKTAPEIIKKGDKLLQTFDDLLNL